MSSLKILNRDINEMFPRHLVCTVLVLAGVEFIFFSVAAVFLI